MWTIPKIKRWLTPICFICKKEVEVFEFAYDISRMKAMFRATCHGEYEVMHTEPELFVEHRNNLRPGYAFLPIGKIDQEKVAIELKKK